MDLILLSAPFRCYRLSLINSLNWSVRVQRMMMVTHSTGFQLSWIPVDETLRSVGLTPFAPQEWQPGTLSCASFHSWPLCVGLLTCHSQPGHPPCRKSRWVRRRDPLLHKLASGQVTRVWLIEHRNQIIKHVCWNGKMCFSNKETSVRPVVLV